MRISRISNPFNKYNSVRSITILSALLKINPQPQHRLNANHSTMSSLQTCTGLNTNMFLSSKRYEIYIIFQLLGGSF